MKEDALFHKQTRCNTCKGHGKLVQSACPACDGNGFESREETVQVFVSRFSTDGDRIELPLRGHMTLFPESGKNGTLIARVRIREEVERWREGINVRSRHYVSLSDAI